MRRVTSLLSTAALIVGLSGVAFTPAVSAAPAGATDSTAQPPSVPDQLLVGYDAGTSARDRAAARSRAGSRLVSVVVPESRGRAVVELVATPAGGRGQAERRFESDPKVSYAEPNWIYEHAATSNDPSYTDGTLWGMYGDATTPPNQYGSQAGEAWAADNTGSSTVYVGVIDEGIQITHPDLAANIWTNPVEAAGAPDFDDDGNGYKDDVNGWDFDGNNNTVYDGTGDDHGTHVAGTIGATGGNGIGVAGVAWNVKLIPTKFLGSNGGTTANAVKAVDYLTDLKTRHNINLVASNNSWGGGGFSDALYAAIERANTAGILFVAAAGNGGRDGKGDDNDVTPSYPASYSNANIIAVAAIDKDGLKPSWSNYGATSVDLGAPGRGVMSTLPDNTYGSYSGTSMATPHVAGAAALYASVNAGASAAAIKNAIMTSTVPTESMNGKTVTNGRLNASGFFADTVPPTKPATPTVAATTVGGELSVDWADNPTTDGVVGYDVYRSADGLTFGKVTPEPVTASAFADTALVDGATYHYYVSAVDAAGLVSEASDAASGVPSNTKPPAPTGLSATAGDSTVGLDWTDNPQSDISSYKVYRATGTDPASLLGSTEFSFFSDQTAVNGQTYTYFVTAVDTALHESDPSTPVSASPVATSTTAGITLVSAVGSKVKGLQQVELRWTGGDSSTGVEIRRTGTSAKNISAANIGEYLDKLGIKGSGTYHYEVCQGPVCSDSLTVIF